MRHHALPYQAVEGGELDALRPQLAAVAEALGNFAFAGDVCQGAARDTFFKVPFERVPDLVAGRRVLLRGGWAYVSRHEVGPPLSDSFHVMHWFYHPFLFETLLRNPNPDLRWPPC